MTESTMTKNKKGIIIQFSYFVTKNASRVLVDVVFLLLHRWKLYFRVVPSFPQLRYDEQCVVSVITPCMCLTMGGV